MLLQQSWRRLGFLPQAASAQLLPPAGQSLSLPRADADAVVGAVAGSRPWPTTGMTALHVFCQKGCIPEGEQLSNIAVAVDLGHPTSGPKQGPDSSSFAEQRRRRWLQAYFGCCLTLNEVPSGEVVANALQAMRAMPAWQHLQLLMQPSAAAGGGLPSALPSSVAAGTVAVFHSKLF